MSLQEPDFFQSLPSWATVAGSITSPITGLFKSSNKNLIRRPFEQLTLPSLAALMICTLPSAASSANVSGSIKHRTSFGVWMGYVPLGKADFDFDISDNAYSVKGSGKTNGLVEVFTSGYGNFSSVGKVAGNKITVVNHQAEVKGKEKTGVLKMTFDGQGVTSVYQKPDKRKKRMNPKKYVVVQPEQLRKVIDPASAILIAVDQKDILNGNAVCNRTVPVYDGETRYNMVLTYKTTKEFKTDGYSGPVVVCNMRYVPIAGHRKKHRSVEYMSNNRNINLWFAPMEGSRYLSPIKIEVGTWIGNFVASAEYFGKF